ncbi:hypothetical protein [Bacillus sp. 1P06AnD]|uniref:hypothetical protein n=1 Tax=Bacillus sp. 1P06AnD TaxID=3132208 RepID=UPI0039A20AA4
MTRIPNEERDIIEQEIYLPMVITILERDRKVIDKSHLKLKKPYLELVDCTIKEVYKDIKKTRDYLRKNKIKVFKQQSDEAFTMYTFIYKGYEEHHNYFNPRLRNKCEELLTYYLKSPSN